MSDLNPAFQAPPEASTAAPEAPEKPTEPTAVAPEVKTDPEPKANPWDDPEAAKAEIERLRRENGANRTNAKQQAAQDARNELAQTIGKALGLVKDEPVDPAELTKQLTTTQAAAQQAQVELAVFKAAGDNADPLALLDSRTFLAKVKELDPSDTAAFTAAIAEAVEQNPRLGKAAAPVAPGMEPNPAQGRSASPPATVAEQIAAAQAAGDVKTALRLKASMAMHPNP